jgi:hypothetical protein
MKRDFIKVNAVCQHGKEKTFGLSLIITPPTGHLSHPVSPLPPGKKIGHHLTRGKRGEHLYGFTNLFNH